MALPRYAMICLVRHERDDVDQAIVGLVAQPRVRAVPEVAAKAHMSEALQHRPRVVCRHGPAAFGAHARCGAVVRHVGDRVARLVYDYVVHVERRRIELPIDVAAGRGGARAPPVVARAVELPVLAEAAPRGVVRLEQVAARLHALHQLGEPGVVHAGQRGVDHARDRVEHDARVAARRGGGGGSEAQVQHTVSLSLALRRRWKNHATLMYPVL